MERSCDSAEWYEIAFGELYSLIYEHRDDAAAAREAAHLVEAHGFDTAGARVLDLCCGAGRHTEALSGMGFNVVGIDLSPQLIDRAAERDGLAGRVVRGDMRRLPFRQSFDLVLNLFTSFGYFDDHQNAAALAEMSRVLVPGGELVIDHINRERLERQLVPKDSVTKGGARIHQERAIEGDRVKKRITVEMESGRNVSFTEDVRLYRPEEVAPMMAAAGLEDVAIYGSFDGSELTGDSDRMIIVARRGREAEGGRG